MREILLIAKRYNSFLMGEGVSAMTRVKNILTPAVTVRLYTPLCNCSFRLVHSNPRFQLRLQTSHLSK